MNIKHMNYKTRTEEWQSDFTKHIIAPFFMRNSKETDENTLWYFDSSQGVVDLLQYDHIQ